MLKIVFDSKNSRFRRYRLYRHISTNLSIEFYSNFKITRIMGKNIRVILLKTKHSENCLSIGTLSLLTFVMVENFFIHKEDIHIFFPLCLTFPSRKLKKNTFLFNKNSQNDTMPSFLYAKCIQLFLILFRSNPFFVLCAFP